MTIKDSVDKAKTFAKDTVATVKSTSSDALANARGAADSAVQSARGSATQARQRTADGVDANPVAALIGGLALGALAAAVLPRTRKEDELLGGIGGKITDQARTAAQAAKEAGMDKLDELGITKENAMDKAKELAQTAVGAVKETATAAASGAKSS